MSSQKKEHRPEKEIFIKSFLGELPWKDMEEFIGLVSSCPTCTLKFTTLQRVRSDLIKREVAGIGEDFFALEKS